jgi:predicted phosphodiesterase
MHKLLLLTVAFIVVAPAWGDAPRVQPTGDLVARVSKEMNPWTHLKMNNDPRAFQFVIMSDRTGGRRPGVFARAVEKVNLLQPEFVMCVGDLIDGYTEDPAEMARQWDEFDALVEPLEMPFFYVPGNHDISNEAMQTLWRQRYGRSYYHFVYRDVLFLVLDTQDPPREGIGEEQARYVARTLEANPDVRWTLVFMHQPVFLSGKDGRAGWDRVEPLLADRSYTVFVGHWHNYTLYERQGRDYVMLATTGGGSGLFGARLGDFDQIVWVTMTDEGPRLANLALDGIHEKALQTEEGKPKTRGWNVKLDPVLTDGAEMRAGDSQATFVNGTEYPMRYQAYFRPHPQVRFDPAVMECDLPPGESAPVVLTVRAAEPAEVLDVAPAELVARMWIEAPGGPAIELEKTYRLYFGRRRTCPQRSGPVRVDGSLDEWGELPIAVSRYAHAYPENNDWQSEADCSARFAVARGEDTIHVAVRVRDDKLVLDSSLKPWKQDAVELRLSAGPAPVLDPGERPRRVKEQLLVAISPGGEGKQPVLHTSEDAPDGVRAAAALTEGGYAVEVAIPSAFLDQKLGRTWEAFRLNLAIDDYDESAGAGGVNLWWHPDWRHPDYGDQAALSTFHRD